MDYHATWVYQMSSYVAKYSEFFSSLPLPPPHTHIVKFYFKNDFQNGQQNQLFHRFAHICIYAEQEAQSYCDIFRQKGVEMTDRTDNNCFSIKTLSEKLKPLFFCLTLQFVIFYYY